MKPKPDATPYIPGHRKWYIAGFIVALLLLAWASVFAHQTVAGWESRLFTDINNWPDKLRQFFVVVSLVGGSVWAAAGAVVVTFFLKMYRLCWRMAVTIFGAYAAAYLLKHFVGRGRPGALMTHIHVRAVETGMGFPSGHATIATVVSLTLLPYLPVRWRWIPPVWIVLVVLSRLYLGVHFPLDVLGGVCVGVLAVAFIRIMPHPLRVFFRLD